MNLLEIAEIRDRLKEQLAVVEKFLEIAKTHGSNFGVNGVLMTQQPTTTKVEESQQKSPVLAPNQRELPGTKREYGAIANIVREVVNVCPEKYTIRDISSLSAKLNKPLSKLQIATALNRFVRKGEIHIHRKGKGSKPTIYKKTPSGDEKI
jgi:hypothetical protein